MKTARGRERCCSVAAASTESETFSETWPEKATRGRRGQRSSVPAAASTETETFNAAFSETCTECGKPTEPSQRDKYLCRCFSCDRKFRASSRKESKQVSLFVF